MPSSNKTSTVRVPTVKLSSLSQINSDASICSDGLSVGSRMAPITAQDTQETSRMWTYRVRGIPVGLDWEATTLLIESTLQLRNWELRSLAPDPIREREQVATFEVLQPPYGTLRSRPDLEWKFSISNNLSENTHTSNSIISDENHSTGNTSMSNHNVQGGKAINKHKKSTLTVDKHFRGLTPLNCLDKSQGSIEYDISSSL